MDKLLVLPKTGRIFAGTHKIQIDLMQRMKKVAHIPAVNWCLITSNHANTWWCFVEDLFLNLQSIDL